jgi:hypothetical protein
MYAPLTNLVHQGAIRNIKYKFAADELLNLRRDAVKSPDKQPKSPSKAGKLSDKRLPSSDVSAHAAKGGDKESNEPLRRPLKGTDQPETTPTRKPRR